MLLRAAGLTAARVTLRPTRTSSLRAQSLCRSTVRSFSGNAAKKDKSAALKGSVEPAGQTGTRAGAGTGGRESGSGSAKSKGSAMRKVGFVVFSGLVGLTAYLGAWQTKRYFWKVDVMAARDAKLAQEPRHISSLGEFVAASADAAGKHPPRALAVTDPDEVSSAETDTPEFTPVVVRGELLNSESVLLGPRSPPKHSAAYDNDHGEKSGYHIITPMRVVTEVSEAKEEVVLVNRGWVPKSKHDRVMKSIMEASNEVDSKEATKTPIVEITAVVRGGEVNPSSFIPPPDLANRHFYSLDIPAVLDLYRSKNNVGAPEGTHQVSFVSTHVLEQLPPTGHPDLEAKPLKAHADFYIIPSTHVRRKLLWFMGWVAI
eukprot:INCI1359.1.p2 GENE.INCI1359.1~~INCI1359.1.p2  ORF type:complete len:373 (-),score=56.10 INCI1359.1:203-1321(-)